MSLVNVLPEFGHLGTISLLYNNVHVYLYSTYFCMVNSRMVFLVAFVDN